MATAKTRAKGTKTSPKKATSRAKPKKTAVKKTVPVEQPIGPVRYAARNATHYEFGLRLERQQGTGKRRFELKPRGQRGDFVLLQEGDLEDPSLQDQVNLGVIEIITATEATKVAQKQTTNQQKVHPALAMIRNEYGEEYDQDSVHVTQSFEDQGVVVAELTDGQIAVDRGGIVRSGQPQPERGNRLRRPGERPRSSRNVTQSPQTIRTRPDDAASANADSKARIKGLGGPSAGVPDGITVTVAPTERN